MYRLCSYPISPENEYPVERAFYKCAEFPNTSRTSVQMSCPYSWKDEEISEKCNLSSNSKLNSSNLDITTPVVGISTNKTYSNVYCAICNLEKNYQYWNVTAEYSNDSRNYNPVSQIPNELFAQYCQKISVISSCVNTSTSEEAEELCKSSYALVVDQYERYYRNKYCAYCNNVQQNGTFCPLYSSPKNGTSEESLLISLNSEDVRSLELSVCDTNTSNEHISKIKEHFCTVDERQFHFYIMVAIHSTFILLIIHLVMFSVVKEMQTFAGKNLASMGFAFFLIYLSLLVRIHLHGVWCHIAGYLIYYSYLVAFAYILTMVYEMWRVFRNLSQNVPAAKTGKYRFLFVSLINCSVPLVLVVIIFLKRTFLKSVSVQPAKIPTNRCRIEKVICKEYLITVPALLILLATFSLLLHILYMAKTKKQKLTHEKTRISFTLFSIFVVLIGLTYFTGLAESLFDSPILLFAYYSLLAIKSIFFFKAFTWKKKFRRSFLIRVGILKASKSDLKMKRSRQGSATDKESDEEEERNSSLN